MRWLIPQNEQTFWSSSAIVARSFRTLNPPPNARASSSSHASLSGTFRNRYVPLRLRLLRRVDHRMRGIHSHESVCYDLPLSSPYLPLILSLPQRRNNGCKMSASRALEALYVATDGAQWSTNDGWNIGTDPCDNPSAPWAGISCSGNQVVAVLLILFGLQGHLPTELGLLTNAEYFDFTSNFMSGTVPTQVGNLRSTYSFDARNAEFLSGTIPTELCEVTRLNRLQWGNTRVSGTLPAEIQNWQSMKYDVSLAGTQLSGTLPTQLGLWTDLQDGLNLHGAALSGAIPTELGTLKKLTGLDVGGNQFSGTLPSQLAGLSLLRCPVLTGGQAYTCPLPILPSDCGGDAVEVISCEERSPPLPPSPPSSPPSPPYAPSPPLSPPPPLQPPGVPTPSPPWRALPSPLPPPRPPKPPLAPPLPPQRPPPPSPPPSPPALPPAPPTKPSPLAPPSHPVPEASAGPDYSLAVAIGVSVASALFACILCICACTAAYCKSVKRADQNFKDIASVQVVLASSPGRPVSFSNCEPCVGRTKL